MPLATFRIHTTRISAKGAALYQRALRTIGIADCTEMRVTSAVAVCVALYYIISLVVWAVNTITDATTITALVQ